MDTTNIDSTTPPQEERCTAHTFQVRPDPDALGRRTINSGAPLRMSHTANWPPAILFDAVYASAVLHNFGTLELKNEIRAGHESGSSTGTREYTRGNTRG